MKYEVKESKEHSGEFLAVAVNEASHNEIFSALFSGRMQSNAPRSMPHGKIASWK